MIYTEKQKSEMERVLKAFSEHISQSPNIEILWSDKVGYVWLEISLKHLDVDTATKMETAADLCRELLRDITTDVLFMTGNDHPLENADPLEIAEIKQRWQKHIDQLPEYAYLCDELLNE